MEHTTITTDEIADAANVPAGATIHDFDWTGDTLSIMYEPPEGITEEDLTDDNWQCVGLRQLEDEDLDYYVVHLKPKTNVSIEHDRFSPSLPDEPAGFEWDIVDGYTVTNEGAFQVYLQEEFELSDA